MIAGGVNEGNIQDLLRVQGAVGVDASSGLEVDPKTNPGKKDIGKLRSYIRKIRFPGST